MAAIPLPTAVTSPLLLTVATSVLPLLQVTLCPLGETVADSIFVSPTFMVRLDWDSSTRASFTVTEQDAEREIPP